MLGPSCARQRRHRSSAVMSSVHRPQLYAVQPSPGSPLVYYCIEIQPTIRPTLFHPAAVSSHKKCWRVGAELQQSGSSHSRAVFLHCPDTTTGSGQQAAAKNWLELFDILHGAATAAVNPLLLLSSLASFAFYTGRSFAQFFLVSGLPLCPLSGGINELSGKFSQ